MRSNQEGWREVRVAFGLWVRRVFVVDRIAELCHCWTVRKDEYEAIPSAVLVETGGGGGNNKDILSGYRLERRPTPNQSMLVECCTYINSITACAVLSRLRLRNKCTLARFACAARRK